MRAKKDRQAVILAVFTAIIGVAFVVAWGQQPTGEAAKPTDQRSEMLIDDFAGKGQRSPLGAKWAFLTDKVMGGVSTGKMAIEEHEGQPTLHMTGAVSLKNNGGFIQTRLALHPRGRDFDARAFRGIQLRVKGNGETYAVHLRTRDTRFA